MTTVRPFLPLRVLITSLLLPSMLLAQDQRSTKAYDLRFLVVGERTLLPAQRLLPDESWPETPIVGSESEQSVPAIEASDLLQLLTEVTGGGLTADEAKPRLEFESGILFATCDTATHEKVAAWLELCRQVFLEQITFELHVLPATVLSGGRSVLSREEVDALLRPAGPHPIFVTVTRVGRRTLLETNEVSSLVRDNDVEVAQFSQIPDPKLAVLVAGQGWDLVTTRYRDGRLGVRVASQETTQDGPPRIFPVVSHDARGKVEQGRIQLPRIHHVRQVASAMLADGEALLFAVGDANAAVYCLRLRRPLAIPMPSGSGWSWLAAGELVLPSMQAARSRLVLRGPGDESPFLPEIAGDPLPRVLAQDALVDRLRALLRLDDGTNSVRWLPGALLQVRAGDVERKVAQDLIGLLTTTLVRQLTVEVRYGRLGATDAVAVVDGHLDVATLVGKLGGSYLTSCVVQDGFSVLAGTQQSYVRDYEVEIAQDSAAPNVVIGHLFTGISMAGRVQAATHGQFRFELHASFAELANEIESFDLQDSRFSPVDLPKMRDIRCFAAPIVDANKWTLMHLAPLHGTNEHFAVVARVRE